MREHPGIHIGIGGESIPFLRKTIMRFMDEIFPAGVFEKNKRDLIWTLPRYKSSCQFVSLNDEDRLKSFTVGAWCWEEVTNIFDKKIFNRCRTLMRQKGMPNCFYGATNPGAFTHWAYDFFIGNPAKNVHTVYSSSQDNILLPQDYLDDLETLKETNPAYYEMMVKGRWGSLEGMIYHLQMKQRIDSLPVELLDPSTGKPLFDEMIAGLDFGHGHPTAFSIIGYKNGHQFIVDEFYKRGLSSSQVITAADDFNSRYPISVWYCDSARPEIIDDMRTAGINAKPCIKGAGSVFAGIMWLKGLVDSGKVWVVRPNCPYHLREFDSYIWNSKTKKEEPISIANDCMDAWRYADYTHHKQTEFEFSRVTSDGVTTKKRGEREFMEDDDDDSEWENAILESSQGN